MLEIVKENIHRIVSEDAYQRVWKAQGFKLVNETSIPPSPSETPPDGELEELRAHAKSLGVKYAGGMNEETLKAKIAEIESKMEE